MFGQSLIGALIRKEARNSPSAFLAQPGIAGRREVVVCVGDSITRGEVSCSYVEMLEASAGDRYFFVNAGINGELSYNVLERLDEVIRCNPAYVTVLIGTNDANATIKRKRRDFNLRLMRITETPSIVRYEENLRKIVARLGSETRARIALLSLPPIGEDFGHVAMGISDIYGCIVEETARSLGVGYLPVFEEMVAYLKGNGVRSGERYEAINRIFFRSLIEEKLFHLSYDEIADRRNFLLHTDILHLNCTAAAIIARLITSFLPG